MPYFDGRDLPRNPPAEYVVWLDVMGTQARMSRSLEQTANFVFKLHVAAIAARAAQEDTRLSIYPVMDGFYASSPVQRAMLDFLRAIFSDLAQEFNNSTQQIYRFSVRGCLAYGPTIHGRDVHDSASRELAREVAYRNSILLGMPVVQAHSNESQAPPFGIFVHESARALAPTGENPLHEVWWRWARYNDPTWIALGANLQQHLVWCEERSMPLNYPKDRIAAHRNMVEQYFRPLMEEV